MKPFIYRVKNTEVFVMGDEYRLTADRSQATIWQSRNNAVTKEVEGLEREKA